eukprot:11161561-Lingulodinium_polyedra.AAC.1
MVTFSRVSLPATPGEQNAPNVRRVGSAAPSKHTTAHMFGNTAAPLQQLKRPLAPRYTGTALDARPNVGL